MNRFIILASLAIAPVAVAVFVRTASDSRGVGGNGAAQLSSPSTGPSAASRPLSSAWLPAERSMDNVRADSVVWPVDAAEVRRHVPYLSSAELADGRRFIRYAFDALGPLGVRDRFAFYLPNLDMTAEAVIAERVHRSGVISWSGRLAGIDDGVYRFHLSHAPSDRYAIGRFETPAGALEMEVKDGYGWFRPMIDESRLRNDTVHADPLPSPDSARP